MEEERAQILQLLADGKINVEQAETLLLAIEPERDNEGLGWGSLPPGWGTIPDVPGAPPVPPTPAMPPMPGRPARPPRPARPGQKVFRVVQRRPGDKKGSAKPSFDDLIQLAAHGIGPEFLREVRGAGLTDITIDDVAQLGIHGVSPQWILEMREAGYELSVDELVELRIHGVEPEFVRTVRESGLELDVDQIVQLRIHGVDPDTVKAWAESGFVSKRRGPKGQEEEVEIELADDLEAGEQVEIEGAEHPEDL